MQAKHESLQAKHESLQAKHESLQAKHEFNFLGAAFFAGETRYFLQAKHDKMLVIFFIYFIIAGETRYFLQAKHDKKGSFMAEDDDFFIADETEIISYKDDIISMEFPIFQLQSKKNETIIYRFMDTLVEIKSNISGMATIFDKDIWIYAISKLQQAIYENSDIGKSIAFTPYDFFTATRRANGGRSYEELDKSLSRLKGTVIRINKDYLKDSSEKISEFGLIDSWSMVKSRDGKLKNGMVKIDLPDWIYQAVKHNKVLKINPDYFNLKKGLERRIYEICRKHCGIKSSFKISLTKLKEKVGSQDVDRNFKVSIKKISTNQAIPDFHITLLDKENMVLFVKLADITESVKPTETKTKAGREKLPSRPKVPKGSDEEGKWARKCISILVKWKDDIKEVDPNLRMSDDDYKILMRMYKIIGDYFSVSEIENLLMKRKEKRKEEKRNKREYK